MFDNDDFIPEFVYNDTKSSFVDDSEIFVEEDKEEENQIDNIDDSDVSLSKITSSYIYVPVRASVEKSWSTRQIWFDILIKIRR